jgi:hypothetical protein
MDSSPGRRRRQQIRALASQAVRTAVPRLAAVRRWAARRRRTAATQILRGTSYGLGAGAVSLAVFWVENHVL